MNKRVTQCQLYVHGYMICTVLGVALLLPAYEIAMCLLGIGANSIFVSLGVFLAAKVNRFWGICAFSWSIIFPIFLFISYILAIKKTYRMFFVAVVLDTVVSILFTIYSIYEKSSYGVRFAIFDLIVSFIVMLNFARILNLPKVE